MHQQNSQIDREYSVYMLLDEILYKKAYSGIALDARLQDIPEKARPFVTRMVYGVLEKSVQFDYIIQLLADRKPQNSTVLVLKISLYCLRYMDMPDYAAINKGVELVKRIGKPAQRTFVNAFLRKSLDIDLKILRYRNETERISVQYSSPTWVVGLLQKQYGSSRTEAFLGYVPKAGTHIRHNSRCIDRAAFETILETQSASAISSILGYYVTHNMMRSMNPSIFTPQSLASMLAVNCYVDKNMFEEDSKNPLKVLDLCGAPGGKSIYLEELLPGSEIICCDVHAHRVRLIEKYISRMRSNVQSMLNDACQYKKEWEETFDLVVCDVPCSGLGLVGSKPDILLNRQFSDIAQLIALQKSILMTAAKYVRPQGWLCYSTCTVIERENEQIIHDFLVQHPDFSLVPIRNQWVQSEGMLQLLPQEQDCDGFFIAKMRKA